jgi:hypothetical protein
MQPDPQQAICMNDWNARPPLTENPGYVSDDSYMKALSYCKPLLWEAKLKKISCREIYWEKISCAALLQEKNICLVPLGGKKLLHSLNVPTPLPPQKSNGPPLT